MFQNFYLIYDFFSFFYNLNRCAVCRKIERRVIIPDIHPSASALTGAKESRTPFHSQDRQRAHDGRQHSNRQRIYDPNQRRRFNDNRYHG